MKHKFFNPNPDFDQDSKNGQTDYSNHINVTPSRAQNDYIDRNNIVTKISLIILGLFCAGGVIYYIILWMASK